MSYKGQNGRNLENDVSGLDTTTADNGLTETLDNIQLGGTLLHNSTVATGVYSLTVSTSTASVIPFQASATSGIGIYASATTGVGVSAYSASAISLQAQSDGSQYAVDARTYSAASNNSVLGVLQIQALNGAAPSASGFGGSIDYTLMTTDLGTSGLANQLKSKWTTATHATRTSEFSITGVDSAVTKTLLTISGAGRFTLTQGLTDYADDAAASAGGVPVNGLYRTASAVKIRVT